MHIHPLQIIHSNVWYVVLEVAMKYCRGVEVFRKYYLGVEVFRKYHLGVEVFRKYCLGVEMDRKYCQAKEWVDVVRKYCPPHEWDRTGLEMTIKAVDCADCSVTWDVTNPHSQVSPSHPYWDRLDKVHTLHSPAVTDWDLLSQSERKVKKKTEWSLSVAL